MEPIPPTVEGLILNHWTTREIPRIKDLNGKNEAMCVPAESLGEFFYNLEVEKTLLSITQNSEAWGGEINVFDFKKIQNVIMWGKKANDKLEEDLHLNYRKGEFQEFPGGPVVRTLCPQGQESGSIPGQKTKIPQAVWCLQKTKQEALVFVLD